MKVKDVQYEFLSRLYRLSNGTTKPVSFGIMKSSWRDCPKINELKLSTEPKYCKFSESHYEDSHDCKMTIQPDGIRLILETKRAKTSTTVGIIAAVLAGLGVVVTIVLHFFA